MLVNNKYYGTLAAGRRHLTNTLFNK